MLDMTLPGLRGIRSALPPVSQPQFQVFCIELEAAKRVALDKVQKIKSAPFLAQTHRVMISHTAEGSHGADQK